MRLNMAEKLPTKKILIFGLDSHFKEQKKGWKNHKCKAQKSNIRTNEY